MFGSIISDVEGSELVRKLRVCFLDDLKWPIEHAGFKQVTPPCAGAALLDAR
jgi:hypothetical protein